MNRENQESRDGVDIVIVGGGPAGLQAALTLGRARKRVLLCDAGPRRNATARHVQTFVTRDGTPPGEFREIARQQLTEYPNVQVRDVRVESISGQRGNFRVTLASGTVSARRLLICPGMIDEPLPIAGYQERWGHAIFQCPYCHGWEAQDRRWGYLARTSAHLTFPLMLRGWTSDVTVFTGGAVEIPADARERLDAARIRVETAAVARLLGPATRLEAVELATGARVPCDVLFVHPPQRQVDLVASLGLALDEHGSIRVDATTQETSIPGIHAAGDVIERMQSAIIAAASGSRAAGMINHELAIELASHSP